METTKELNLNDILKERKVLFGSVGSQSIASIDGWTDFLMPQEWNVKVNDIEYESNIITLELSDPTSLFNTKKMSVVYKKEYSQGQTSKILQIHPSLHLDLLKEKEEVQYSFDTEVKRILDGNWAGVNNVLQSTTLKDRIKKENYFIKKYPHWIF